MKTPEQWAESVVWDLTNDDGDWAGVGWATKRITQTVDAAVREARAEDLKYIKRLELALGAACPPGCSRTAGNERKGDE